MRQTQNLINEYRNYFIIGILATMAVFFLPMLGTTAALQFVLPNTVAGWIVYVSTKLCIVVINLLIYDQFMKRAKINVKDDPMFIEAERILAGYFNEEEDILPASYYISKMYRSKMTSTAIFTILGVFGFTNAILTFDWVSMLSYTFTIIMALTFGWISMGEAELVWIERHYKYAKKIERERASVEMASPQLPKQKDDSSCDNRGTPLLVAADSPSPISPSL